MSFLDRIAAAVTPAATDEDRAEARRRVEALANDEEWVAMIVSHHKEIESLFTEGLIASDADARRRATKELATLLTGHATAEEAIVYPELVDHDSKGHATMAYEEHAMTKVNLAKLEKMDPMSTEWREKLEHTQGAVLQHIYQEESSWLPNLVEHAPADERALINRRFKEEFERYCGKTGTSRPSMAAAEPADLPPAV